MLYKNIIKKETDIDSKSLKIFGNKSKLSKKLILKYDKDNSQFLAFVYKIRKSGIDLNHLNLTNFLNDLKRIQESKDNKITIKFLKQLKLLFSDKVIIRLFEEENYHLNSWRINDSIKLLDLIVKNEELLKKLKKRKIRSFYYLHQHLNRLSLYIKKEDFSLNQKEDVLKLNNNEYVINEDKIKIIVPNTKHELLKVSEIFDFCIGTADGYGENISKGHYSFISIYKNNKPLQGILFDKSRILEAFNIHNDSASFNIKHFVRKLIFKSKKIEADSSWISHFEYENNILTLIPKSGKSIYEYEVDEEVVNELENSFSRGSFFHYNIKGKFKSQKKNIA